MTSVQVAGRTWLRFAPSDAPCNEPQRNLVCFPHAGAGAASFAGWPALFPPQIRTVRVQLPGREDAIALPPLRRVADAVDALLPQVTALPGAPVALYGHSMGAVVAFELARALDALGVAPAHLFVSGRRAPQLRARSAPVHRLPDDELVAELDRMGGLPGSRSPAFLRYTLRLVRADLELSEEYVHRPAMPLPCPITAFHGTSDPIVERHQVAAWAEQTSGGFTLHAFPGDHFFHQANRAAIAAHIAADIAGALR